MSNLSNSMRKSILAEKKSTTTPKVTKLTKGKTAKPVISKNPQQKIQEDLLSNDQNSFAKEATYTIDNKNSVKQNKANNNLPQQLFELVKDLTAIPVEGAEDITIINVNVIRQLLLDYKDIFTKLNPMDFMSNLKQIVEKNKEINSDYWQALNVSLSLTQNRINQILQQQYLVFGNKNYLNLFSNPFMNFNKFKTNN